MKRFSLHAVIDMAEMKEAPKGRWVLFDDAWPRIAEVQEKVHKLRAQLAEVTAERDHFKRAAELADALRNRERGM